MTEQVAEEGAGLRPQRVPVARSNVLHTCGERAAEGNGQDLEAAAHPQQRYARRGGRSGQGDLGVVAAAVDVAAGRRVDPGEQRVDVTAAGQHDGVRDVEQLRRVGAGKQHGPRSDRDQPLDVRRRAAGHG